MTDDIITRYTKTILEQEPDYDIPEIFVKASGYHLVSSLLGRFFRCPLMPSKGRPNLWFIISSIPGRMRRSTILNLDSYVYRHTLLKYYEKLGLKPLQKEVESEEELENQKGVTEKQILEWRKKRTWNTIIEEGTPEGIVDKIESTKLKDYTIMSTEFGGVLRRMRSRDYQVGVSSLLSKLYYGEGGSTSLSRRGGKKGERFLREGLFVTMFAGMQEPKYYLDQEVIRQGLLRRILICYVPKAEKWTEPLQEGRELIYSNLDIYVDELSDWMVKLKKLSSSQRPPLLDAFFGIGVRETINDYARELDASLDANPNNVNIYKQSLWEHLTKLSMCRAIARRELASGGNTINISMDDYRRAKPDLLKAIEHAEDIIASLGEKAIPVRTSEEPLDRIYGFIRDAGKGGIQRQKLYRKAKVLQPKLDTLLSTLIISRKVSVKRQKTKGRNADVYTTE